MKKLLIAFALFMAILGAPRSGYALLNTANFAFGKLTQPIPYATGPGATFNIAPNVNSGTFPASNFLVVIYSSVCNSASNCPSREIMLISSVNGNTFTIGARDQEGTAHYGDWSTNDNVVNIVTAGTLNDVLNQVWTNPTITGILTVPSISSSGTSTLNIASVKQLGTAFLASSGKYATFNAIDAAAHAAGGTSIIDTDLPQSAGTYTTTAPVMMLGGMITSAGTSSLYVNSSFTCAPGAQAFSGFASGQVTFAGGSVKEVRPEWWGAARNGVTDDSASFNAALMASKLVSLSSGTYLVEYVRLQDGTILEGAGQTNTFLKQRNNGTAGGIVLAINRSDEGSADVSDNKRNIVVRDLSLVGTVVEDGFSEFIHLMQANAVSGLLIERVTFSGFRGDGLYIGSVNGVERHNENITVRHCTFDGINNNNRNGISISDCDGCFVKTNTFKNITRLGMPGAIDIEPDNSFDIVKNIYVDEGNKFTNIGGSSVISLATNAAVLDVKPSNIHFDSNIFSDITSSGGNRLVSISTGETPTAGYASMNISVCNNEMNSLVQSIVVSRTKGVKICRNTFNGTSTVEVGLLTSATITTIDTELFGNTYNKTGAFDGALLFGTVSGLNIHDETFNEPKNASATSFIKGYGSGIVTTSNRVAITNNTFFKGSSNPTFIVTLDGGSGHTTSAPTNLVSNNTSDANLRVNTAFYAGNVIYSGVTPTTTPADAIRVYAKDFAAGQAMPCYLTENLIEVCQNQNLTTTSSPVFANFNGILSGTTNTFGGSLLATIGTCTSGTATVTGAAVTHTATAQPEDGVSEDGIVRTAWVSAPDTVTVKECALVAVTPAARRYYVRVIK